MEAATRKFLVWENPELAESILAGIQQAHRGELVDLGDFTQYIAEEDED